jgi:hypothetical protein
MKFERELRTKLHVVPKRKNKQPKNDELNDDEIAETKKRRPQKFPVQGRRVITRDEV